MQNEINEIDVKSGPGVFRHYEHLDLRPWYCLGEYIDNAIGSMEANLKELKAINPNFVLRVVVQRDSTLKKIYITDNAGGISDKDIERAFWIGERPEDTSGAHEYGVGMKMASFHFSDCWSVRTSAIGEPVEKYIELDVNKIENTSSTIIDVQRQSKGADIHFTEICLESFYASNWPRGKTINKIKKFLSSMYRRYIDDGKLILIFDDNGVQEHIKGSFPEILNMNFVKDDTKNIKEWKQEISFKHNNKEISGWVGLLEKPSGVDSGFDLIRRNKIIEGDENAWKPDAKESSEYSIFGGSHSNSQSRLFGELVFKNFQTNNNKSRIRWTSDSDDTTKDAFLKYLYNLIKMDISETAYKKTDKLRDFWFQLENYINFKTKEKKKIDNDLKKIISSQAAIISSTMGMDHIDFSPPDNINENLDSKSMTFIDKEKDMAESSFTVDESRGRKWSIRIIPYEGDGQTDWFQYDAVETDKWPKEITIKIDINHPYSIKVFKVNEDASVYRIIGPELFKFISYLVIGELKLDDLNRKQAGISYYRDFINKSLRGSSNK